MYVLESLEQFAPGAVTVAGTGLTTVATISPSGRKVLCFHFDVATQNIDDFDVLARAHPSAQLIDFTPSNWASIPSGSRFRRVNADLAAVAAAGNGYFEMAVDGLAEVVVRASAAADSAAVTPYYSLH